MIYFFKAETVSVMEPLELLELAPLRIKFQTLTAFRSPEYKGALFRGGFGEFFRGLTCVTGAPTCAGCFHSESCAYLRVFESPVRPEQMPVLRRYPYAPHPFVLTPPLDPRTALPVGTELALELTLIGPGIRYLPHFIAVFDALGRSGRYGGAFRLKRVTSALEEAVVIYDGSSRRLMAEPPLWRPPHGRAAVERMRLEFVTPLRIRTEGRYNARPDLVAVTHALLRRIHLLAAVYGGGNGDASWMRPLLAAADRAVTERADFRLYEWSRTSGRQRRRVEMDGVVGTLEARGDLGALAPYFEAGRWLHVGSGTSMGMGRYELLEDIENDHLDNANS